MCNTRSISEASLCDQAQQAFATKIDVQLSNMGEASQEELISNWLKYKAGSWQRLSPCVYNAKVRCVNGTPVVDDEYYMLKGDQRLSFFMIILNWLRRILRAKKHNHK